MEVADDLASGRLWAWLQRVLWERSRLDEVLNLVLQFDPCRLDLACERIVEVLIWVSEVVGLQGFQSANLVKPDDASLVEGYEELAA